MGIKRYKVVFENENYIAISIVVKNDGNFTRMIQEIKDSNHVGGNYEISGDMFFADVVYDYKAICSRIKRFLRGCYCDVFFNAEDMNIVIQQNLDAFFGDYFDSDVEYSEDLVYVFDENFSNDLLQYINVVFAIPIFGDRTFTSNATHSELVIGIL